MLDYVRPLLEFAIPVWSPYYKRDIRTLEKVQGRATRIPFFRGNLSYEDRCKCLDIQLPYKLRDRRYRGDMIQKYKLDHQLDRVKWSSEPIKVDGRGTQREQYRREIVWHCDQRYHFFNNRVATSWNQLPNSIVNSTSTTHFKIKFDEFK